jgi:hypothetical protein
LSLAALLLALSTEPATAQRAGRLFDAIDADGDARVTASEIERMRARADVDAAFERLRIHTQAAQTAVHEAPSKIMLDLPADVRARWAERWQPARRLRGGGF